MSRDPSPAFHTVESADALTDDELLASINGPDLISDDDIDYAGIARRTQPGQPGGKIIFDSADYATDEEAMAALEALLLHDLMGPDERQHTLAAALILACSFLSTRTRRPSASFQPLTTYGEITFTPNSGIALHERNTQNLESSDG